MALLECKLTMELVNSEKDGFMEMEGYRIAECAEMIQTPAETTATSNDPKNIASMYGNLIANLENTASENKDIAAPCRRQLLALDLLIAAAPYEGKRIELRLHTFLPDRTVEKQCTRDLEGMRIGGKKTGLEKRPDSILELRIGGRAAGLYCPGWNCFIPSAGFQKQDASRVDEILKKYQAQPHVVKRCRALLTALLPQQAGNPSDAAAGKGNEDWKSMGQAVIDSVLKELGGRLTGHEMQVYEGEEREPLPDGVAAYIQAVSPGADAGAACGFLGRNTPGKLLEDFAMINTGEDPVENVNPSTGRAGDRLVILPPVRNVTEIEAVSYELGPVNESGVPEWMEFQARLDGVLYHKIYTCSKVTCRPSHYIDLTYQVPDGILSKYHYLVQKSAAPSVGLDDFEPEEAEWKLYPEDPAEERFCFSSLQYRSSGSWEILRRTKRIQRMELCEKGSGRVLGTIILENPRPFRSAGYTRYLSQDTAGAQSVRLVSDKGSGKAGGLKYSKMVYPVTPMAESEYELAVEQRTGSPDEAGTHFASLIQNFRQEDMNGWAGLMAQSRIWKPDETEMYEALKASPGTKEDVMNKLGVISNMKEALSRPDLPAEEREILVQAMKSYVGLMLLEGVLALAKQGFAVQAGNLEFLISYPANGSGEGFSRLMREIVEGAIDYVNSCLTDANQLEAGRNVMLYSESEATAKWHEINGPAGNYLGGNVAVLTMDYGYSTLDISLQVGDRLYTVSIPIGGQRITNATVAKVYDGDAEGIVRCFEGGSQEKKQQARKTIEEAMNAKRTQLCDCVGFDLTLNRLFNSCSFKVTGVNADPRQKRVQLFTEAKLNVGIPAYADVIVRAIKDGSLEPDGDLFLAPVGKGSLAINNTAKGFEERIGSRIRAEVNYLLKQDKTLPEGTEYTGQITLLPNNDTDKRSVAEGMIAIRDSGKSRPEIVPADNSAGHYLNLAYDQDSEEDKEARQQFVSQLEALSGPAAKADHRKKLEELYQNAFTSLAGRYTLEQFEEAFSRFGYISPGTESAQEADDFDSEILSIVRNQFKNLRAQLIAEGRELVMASPQIEEEMLCGVMMELAMQRMK